MLQARTEEQKYNILTILSVGDVRPCCDFPLDFNKETDCGYEKYNDRLYIDGQITFDQMAEIVDYLRKYDNKRREKARRAGIFSNIDKLWVVDDAIFLKGADVEKAEAFILSLAEFGYDTQELLNEYRETEKITI